ncbi:MAG: alpha/beta hydrolase [Firmicutes bacterium]|nr:alpha/beta hydrolase [Bacillota bacterium]
MKELLIKMVGPKKVFGSKEKIEKFINKKRKVRKYKLPPIKFKSNIVKDVIDECDVYKFSNGESDKIIIYVHGGAYINEASLFHLNFVDFISTKCLIDIYFPIYPLVPNHDYKDAYDLLLKLYKENLGKKIIIMGDSAGGGLALGFTLYLKELNVELPNELILISPWVDVTLTNSDIKKYEQIDPMLACNGLVEIAKIWAKDLDLKHYKISPLYGDFHKLPKIMLFTGDRELLYPDIELLYNKLINNYVESELIVGNNMNHNYPLHPFKESKTALNIIMDEINKL